MLSVLARCDDVSLRSAKVVELLRRKCVVKIRRKRNTIPNLAIRRLYHYRPGQMCTYFVILIWKSTGVRC